MIATVLSHTRLSTTALPKGAEGVRWLEDAEGRHLLFAEGSDGEWSLEPVAPLGFRGARADDSSRLRIRSDAQSVINLVDDDGAGWVVVFYPDDPGFRQLRTFGFVGGVEFTVGRKETNAIVYDAPFVSGVHARLSYDERGWRLVDEGSANGVFVNRRRVAQNKSVELSFGDEVSVLNLHIVVGKGLFSCNDPGGRVRVSRDFVEYRSMCPAAGQEEPPRDLELFYPALRFARSIEPKEMAIDAPPQPEGEEEVSLAMRIGPSMAMALASVLSASVSISTMSEQGASMTRALPSVGMAVAMLLGSVLWPVLNSRSQDKSRRLKEGRRRASYAQYLGSMLAQVSEEERLQREILCENRISVQECLNRACSGDQRLMARMPLHADYLELRLGTGDEPLQVQIKWPDKHFSMDDDEVRHAVDEQSATERVLHDVPVAVSLIEKPVLGVVGDPMRTNAFVRGLVVQLAALNSYENVQLMVLANRQDEDEWRFSLHLPHCMSADRSIRHVAFGLEEAGELGLFMERVLEERRHAEGKAEARDAQPYYVVICASEELAAKAGLVRAVVSERRNLGVSLITTARHMRDLPKECRSVVGIEDEGAYLLDRDDPTGAHKAFAPDIEVPPQTGRLFAFALSKKRLDIKTEDNQIPSRLGFLEMERVGAVEHLSIASRWAQSNASASLACPVGVDALGEPFLLNLHEKFHGPHGLIAGTTGSGKSEFLITYILSMAVNYSPNDVAFVLIDYKGGGLAKAFDNEHVHLPHLAGVITNLDGAAITRSLVSIKSELKRRQALFNRARDVVGGDNVDIYDYLDLFRQGRVSEPCPHLFIVADEFAELKAQEPEFMDELISAARIGRSLGVHLILATQKPSGVVNDQIWSNARFKVCLKVADEADSREMIKRPDAASLTQAGRFYLLVGYNEHFALGQAAYAGTRYMPRERFAAAQDDTVSLITHTGRSLVSVKPKVAEIPGDDTPESVAVLRLIQEAAREEGLAAQRLWLEPMPALLTIDDLATKYADMGPGGTVEGVALSLAPLIGELDDPQRQRQAALRLPVSRDGNALVYGSAGSGAELVLNAALYSLVMTFGPQDLHVYALDFGSGSLRAFAAAPQVGDVICPSDDEKVARFLDLMEREQARRRKAMAEYGGSFERYRSSGGVAPAVFVAINGISEIMESYPRLEDRIVRFIRETGRYGIYLVMTADGLSATRVRLRQSFRQVLACNLSDPGDYASLFGSVRDVPTPKGVGRGLVRTDDGLLEFQAAHLAGGGDDFGHAAALVSRLADDAAERGLVCAPAIPTVPDAVTSQLLRGLATGEAELPYGLFEDTLDPAVFDFAESPMYRALYQRRKSGEAFARAFVGHAASIPGWSLRVVDAVGLLGEAEDARDARVVKGPEAALEYLAGVLDEDVAADGKPGLRLVVVMGIGRAISAGSREQEAELKAKLQRLNLAGGVRMLLIDSLPDVTYAYDDWFKAQLTSRNGLWIGPGLEAQSTISTNYKPGLTPDAEMKIARGHAVEGGTPRLVRLVSEPTEEGRPRSEDRQPAMQNTPRA